MVGDKGLEPLRLAATGLKPVVSAYSTNPPYLKQISVVIANVAISITSWVVRISLLMHLFNQDHLGTTLLVISCWHLLLVRQEGLEPSTHALKGRYSTNWVIGAYWPSSIQFIKVVWTRNSRPWRRVRDSNPQCISAQRFSRPSDYQLSQLSISNHSI